MKNKASIAIAAALVTVAGMGCGGSDSAGPLGNVDALVILQRPARNDTGDIFQYTSYIPGARLVKLSPPTANGHLTVLCCTDQGPDYANIDIQGYDLSFDAKQIVFAGKLSNDGHYGLYLLNLKDNSVTALPTDPGRDYVSPIFLPGNKIMFTTNAAVSNTETDPMPPQHRDEYERGTTTQMGTINVDGTGEQLGPRNLSHRTAPSLASDGRVIFTQWDHLGPENAGHLMFMNSDMTELREAFGKEGTGVSNSVLKAREIAPGRFVAIASDRDRTLQSGALVDVRLGMVSKDANGDLVANTAMSEANASAVILTPDVPLDRSPSASSIGRYYDAYPLDASEHPALLVSWADGPVESSVLDAAGIDANFGIYLYDTTTHERHPILDDPKMWDIAARPLEARTAPPVTSSQIDPSLDGAQALIGAMNTYDSTLHSFNPGEIYGVRIMEGFSSEEGFPEMFGTTMFEGHAALGVAPLAADGSWLAKVPANVPLHLQTVDKFGMSLFNEPVWFSARPGESRVCGGCHEDRAKTTVIDPGITDAAAIGPVDAMSQVARFCASGSTACRQSTDAQEASPTTPPEQIVGVAWDKAIQPIFDAHCTSCHDGTPGPANPSYTITDPMTGTSTTWTFDLTGRQVTMNFGTKVETYSASYFTMAGPDMEAIEKGNLVISGDFKVYMNPEDAAHSIVITKLNPTQLFPSPDATVRAFSSTPHSQEESYTELTPTEFYKLILAADMGVNYYARENNPHSSQY